MATHWTDEQPLMYGAPADGGATGGSFRPGPSVRHDRQALVEAFRAMASEIAEMDLTHVTEEDVIADLGMDSLSMLELVGSLEREYDIRIPEEELVAIRTVRELLEIVERESAKSVSR